MPLFSVLILSLVEGFTEFLPISSTGHLVLAANLLKLPPTAFLKTFEIFIQLGAISAVVFLYSSSFFKNTWLWKHLLVAFLPSALLGYFAYPLIKSSLLNNPLLTLAALFTGGLLLIILELLYRPQEHHVDHLRRLTIPQSLVIGLFQSFSLVPGVSRAAATIAGGLIAGLKRPAAVEFSFLLAVPTMLAATSLDLYRSRLEFTTNQFISLGLGFILSFITAFLAIKFLLAFIKNHTFIPFGIYRIILSLAYWLIVLS